MSLPTWLLNWFGVLGKFLAAIFKAGIKQELEMLVPLASEAVKSVSLTDLTSAAKREAVFTELLGAVSSKQMNIASSVINLAIEMAYNEFKNSDK